MLCPVQAKLLFQQLSEMLATTQTTENLFAHHLFYIPAKIGPWDVTFLVEASHASTFMLLNCSDVLH